MTKDDPYLRDERISNTWVADVTVMLVVAGVVLLSFSAVMYYIIVHYLLG